MSIKLKVGEPDGICFITLTCFKWLSIFSIANSYDPVYKWFHYLKLKSHYIIDCVIMPNHLHALIAFSNKRFMAYDIAGKLKEKGNENILDQLGVNVKPSD